MNDFAPVHTKNDLEPLNEAEQWAWSVVALVVKEASGRYGLTLFGTVQWVASGNVYNMTFLCSEVGMTFSIPVYPEHVPLYRQDAAMERATGLGSSYLYKMAKVRDERR